MLLYAQFDLLSILHPTPAVCGHPQALAKEAITSSGELHLLLTSFLIDFYIFSPSGATVVAEYHLFFVFVSP